MFGIIDHVSGAWQVRIRRTFFLILKKPDASYINKNMAVGGHCSIKSLVKNNFECILDMRQESQDDDNEIKKYSINYLSVPVKDRINPNPSQVKEVIKWIDENMSKNKKIFIHCKLGRGRAPTIACLYLISKGMTPNNAILFVKKNRRYTYFNKKQINFIQNFTV